MYFPVIDEYLRRETTSEKWHKEHPGQKSNLYYNDRYFKEVSEGVYYTSYSPELTFNDLIVMKESRYTELYPGFHDNYEITFLYSGKSTYYINGDEIPLSDGDIILIKKDVIRSTDYSDSNDIIINIVFKEEMADLQFINNLFGYSFISDFFANSFFKPIESKKYLVIKNQNNRLLNLALESVCTLYFSERKFNYTELMTDYFHILFQLLINAMSEYGSHAGTKEKSEYVIYSVLNYIANHFQDCTLKSMAEDLGYNYTYLSNLIKDKLGKSFTEIKLEYQLNSAYKLLKNRQLSISDVCQECGFQNRSYFYKKFEQRYKKTPADIKETNRR